MLPSRQNELAYILHWPRACSYPYDAHRLIKVQVQVLFLLGFSRHYSSHAR